MSVSKQLNNIWATYRVLHGKHYADFTQEDIDEIDEIVFKLLDLKRSTVYGQARILRDCKKLDEAKWEWMARQPMPVLDDYQPKQEPSLTVNGITWQQDVLILPDGSAQAYPLEWDLSAKGTPTLSLEKDFPLLMDDPPKTFIVGTGANGSFKVGNGLFQNDVEVICLPTDVAISEYRRHMVRLIPDFKKGEPALAAFFHL